MKAVTEPCVRPAELGLRTETHFKVAKTSKADDAQHTAEMQECFSKLRELVPSIPPNKRLSRTALLQHVIDYILDLECTLDRHPVNQTPFPAVSSPATRSPLSEKSEPNTLVSSGSDVEDEIRPVSK